MGCVLTHSCECCHALTSNATCHRLVVAGGTEDAIKQAPSHDVWLGVERLAVLMTYVACACQLWVLSQIQCMTQLPAITSVISHLNAPLVHKQIAQSMATFEDAS